MGRKCALAVIGIACVLALGKTGPASAEILVGDVYLNGYDGWTDMTPTSVVPATVAYPNWGILLTDDKCLMEASDGRVTTSTTAGSGLVKGYDLINTSIATPANYHLKATFSTWDDDGFGLLFGYKDEDNYYRVAFRQQSNGNLGYAAGVSVQKVVGGTVTQIAKSTAFTPPIDNTPFNVDLAVTGSSYAISVNGTAITALNGTESGSTLLANNHQYGVHSWYQLYAGTGLYRGTELRSMTVTDSALSVLKSHTFDTAAPVAFRKLVMKDALGAVDAGADGKGNFRLDFRNGTIVDDSGGYAWATTTAPNIDFIGPSVVVDQAGSNALRDYVLQTRLKSRDDDGIGLLLRASTDADGNATAFYRVNFCNQLIGTDYTRAPQGMSIQKYLNGAWTELYRDNQTAPLFIYGMDVAFDVKAKIAGNAITVQVFQNGVEYDYPTVIDDSGNPILAGTVGFSNWGNGAAYAGPSIQSGGSIYGPYGGIAGTPLLMAVPEPSALVLLGVAASLLLAWRRK
jgi:hypothetical protein